MKVVLQRVIKASVRVNHETIGSIHKGYVIFLGIGVNDTKEQANK